MRKTAEFLSLAALAALVFITINVFYGPHPLPGRVPTHFDALGHVNSWGSPRTLIFMPIVGVGLYLFLAAVARFPALFNYPVKVTEANRAQLEPLALSMITWAKAEVLIFNAWMEFVWVHAARHPEQGLLPYPVPLFIIVLLATVIGFIVAMFRAAKTTR
jgi:uncharacterized membrane protein